MYNSKENALKIGAFEIVYMTDNEDNNDVSTDSSYKDNDDNDIPQWGNAKSRKYSVKKSMLFCILFTYV